jgi:hypothetical protein
MSEPNPRFFDQPFPLQIRFRRWALPAVVVTFGVLLFLVGFGGSRLIENVYLGLAEDRARTIDLAILEESHDAWWKLLSGAPPQEVYAGEGGEALRIALLGEVRELGAKFTNQVQRWYTPELLWESITHSSI